MKKFLFVCLLATACSCAGYAQTSGNVGYSSSGGPAGAEQNERAKRSLTKDELPPTPTSQFVEANVLMNVRANEYVAVFGVTQEGATIAECGRKMDSVVSAFSDELRRMGIPAADFYVDFIAQNRTYDYNVEGDLAKEKLAGFELKKNVSVHYRDGSKLDDLILAASKSQIFDLIKVDYIVSDPAAVQDRVTAEAARIVKQKAARLERLLGIRLGAPAQVYANKPSTYFPTNMYDSYAAYESEDVMSGYYRQKYTIQSARKSRTFYFHGLDASQFDSVINPVITEPVVQFTVYLKVRYLIVGDTPARHGGKSKRSVAPVPLRRVPR